MRDAVRVGTCAVALFAFQTARADEAATEPARTCETAFEEADLRLRPGESRLLDARRALRACAHPTCKPWMVDDCSKRLAEVEGRIPSVALSAENAEGAPLYDVRVLEAERELAPRLNGLAIELDPGPHELVADYEGTRLERAVVVVEGKKAQQVVFRFGSAAPRSTLPEVKRPLAAAEPAFVHPWARPFAVGLLAGSVLATGTGVVLGAFALGRKQDAHCDAANFCDAEPLGDARSTARSATVAFALGGVLAAGGAVTFFAFGRTRVQATASLNRVGVAATW
jgi:hypothetical protein